MTTETKKYLLNKANEQVAHNVVMYCLRNNVDNIGGFFDENTAKINEQVQQEYDSLVELWNTLSK